MTIDRTFPLGVDLEELDRLIEDKLLCKYCGRFQNCMENDTCCAAFRKAEEVGEEIAKKKDLEQLNYLRDIRKIILEGESVENILLRKTTEISDKYGKRFVEKRKNI